MAHIEGSDLLKPGRFEMKNSSISPKVEPNYGSVPEQRSIFDSPMPMLLIAEAALEHNLAAMHSFCDQHHVELAPHCKTHMSPQLWERQVAHGSTIATVATAQQAQALAASGATSILVANEVTAVGDVRLLDVLRRQGIDVMIFVDSSAGIGILEATLDPALPPLQVLVDYGLDGYRTGCRTLAELLTLAAHVRSCAALELHGMSGYEGVLGRPGILDRDAVLDDYLSRLLAAVHALREDHDGMSFIVTLGGSDLYPAVVEAFGELAKEPQTRVILRSGCYLVHDDGKYARAQAAMSSQLVTPAFRAALQVWAPIISTPQTGLAVLGLGNRNASYDLEPPIPLKIYRDNAVFDTRDVRVTAMYDQHAVLSVGPRSDVRVGDIMAVGISHPCTTFDKWRSATIIDEQFRQVQQIQMMFDQSFGSTPI